MSERIVVIGSNSFSGSHFVAHALRAGLEVVGISRSQEPDAIFLPYKKGETELFRFYALDLNHDLDKIMEVINNFRPDYVVNFAAQGMVAQSWERPEDWFRTNTLSTITFHDRLRRADFLKKYVHISTPEVYGATQGVVKEGTQYNPSTPYAVSRAAADMSLMSFFKAYDFPVVFTRAANVYGPGQQLYRIIPRTVLYFLLGKKLQLHGGGVSVRSFIHIDDVAEGTLRVAQQGQPGEIYHFSTTESISIYDLVQLIATQMDVSFDQHVEVSGDRLGKDSAYLLDSTRAKETLGWQDNIDLQQGIEETISWVKDNIEILKAQPLEYCHKP